MLSRTILNMDRRGSWLKPALLLAWLGLISGGRVVQADDPAPCKIPPPLKFNDRAVRPALLSVSPGPSEAPAPRIEVSTSEVRTDAPAVPGAKLALHAGRGAPPGTRFLWIQNEGPPLELGDTSRPSIEVTIPAGAEKLGFILVAAQPELVRVIRINVPLQGDPSRVSWGAQPTGRVKADAGDDQVGLVSHRVTLNGSRSRPGDGKNARWLQISGPPVISPQYQGPFFSFIPTSPGLYRFLLIVAGDGELSEPDEVTVLVGSPPPGAAGLSAPAVTALEPAVPAAVSLLTPEQILSAAVPRLAGRTSVASDVADVMDAIAHRATLYESFAALQSELARRLDVVIPAEPATRAAWADGVFTPLTAYTTSRLLSAGLDVRQPQGLKQPLTSVQQEIVRDHFERMARAFRAVLAAR
jgi:hypothetical protein